MILSCREKPVPNSWFSFPFSTEKCNSPAGLVPPLFHLTSFLYSH
jgi:hypothetical protein